MLGALVLCTVLIALQLINLKNKKDNILAYTDLIKQIAQQNVEKVEMTTGSTSTKITLKNKIDENNEVITEEGKEEEYNISESNSKKDSKDIAPELQKVAIVPNTQAFVELVQNEVANGNDIELIQKVKVYYHKFHHILFHFFQLQ